MLPADPSSLESASLIEARALAIPERLAALDLDWQGGQLVALLGPNGSGKSTLLGALAGILPAAGTVRLGGVAIRELSWPELAQRQPQLFHIPVFQVLAIGLDERVQVRQPGDVKQAQSYAVDALCDALELSSLLARDFSRLSGGEQQRVLIARTLLQVWPGLNPAGRVLLLDEPLAGLDLHHQLALLRLLKSLARQGLLVVLAIHDINLAIDWADRILCLQQGRVVSEGGVDVIDEALLERVFQIKTDRIEAAGRVWFMPSL
ncbi:ATP-binding cassette domain-containing protein [Aeromonas salmonicida]|uniref:ATP-binding cassette domain-containing protein n=1 Tax=Aeromonas salmonicida TaxID=645 RepID=UPI0036709D17